ncbi:adenosylcobinamide amidohydrolase [Halocatena pleomorpha]|uniref:Adenosylcobinamide amidohydrolase n=1 Tax=Halocatena pleomorpha TaxID=1785090 RepID=A0A3P3RI04_9EURY|nr:adenosylcobinamide amidohydrolase [Halocatena pleomorpha]RRJ32499.1 adenosylcobinamide amidohydrolase [Halocatena pleomorpha]
MSEISIEDEVLQYCRPGTRWLSSGWRGGYRTDPAVYNVSVPEEWDHVDLDAYGSRRRDRAGFDAPGPTLFTGVDLEHARGARCGSVEAVTTAGISNPAILPMVPDRQAATSESSIGFHPGTVNIILSASEPLTDGALATLLGTAVEAKTATLLAESGITGTTSDAIVVGCDGHRSSDDRTQSGDDKRQPFAGSATTVGTAARACVRESVHASLSSRYAETPSPDETEHGVTTTRRATVFEV